MTAYNFANCLKPCEALPLQIRLQSLNTTVKLYTLYSFHYTLGLLGFYAENTMDLTSGQPDLRWGGCGHFLGAKVD